MTETVEVPVETARVALRELNILIKETDDPTGGDEGAMSPLARTNKRVGEKRSKAIDENHSDIVSGYSTVIETINKVAKETGADCSQGDPLQDDIFRAHWKFKEVLEGDD